MKFLMSITAVAAVLFTSQTYAIDMAAGQALAQKSGCMACHAVATKIVGPSLKDIAAKYKGNKKAEAMLTNKVIKGGSGVWGTVSMPPNAAAKPADIKTLVHWVLAQ